MKGNLADLQKVFIGIILLAAIPAVAKEKPIPRPFKYVGGTENLQQGCKGKLEVLSDAMEFKCAKGYVDVPYVSISKMQYRPDVTREIRNLKLNWKVLPPHGGGKRNRYFTVLFTENGSQHVLVLEVSPKDMRPYLAELDLRVGKDIQVESFESFD